MPAKAELDYPPADTMSEVGALLNLTPEQMGLDNPESASEDNGSPAPSADAGEPAPKDPNAIQDKQPEGEPLEPEEVAAEAEPKDNSDPDEDDTHTNAAEEPEEASEPEEATTAEEPEELTQARQELESAHERIAELESQLDTGPGLELVPLHPALMADKEADIDAEDARLAQFENWCLENWDGADAQEPRGDRPGHPEYSAEQVRKRYGQVKEERAQIIKRARQTFNERQKWETVARQEYPDLFNTKKPDYRTARQILRTAPGLKVLFPNIWLVLGDALAGEQHRLARAKTRKGGVRPPIQRKPAPKVPTGGTGGAQASRKPAPAKARGLGDRAEQRLVELGGSHDALVQVLSEAGPLAYADA